MTERRRDFAILSGASAVSQLGSMSVAAAGPLLALAITGSPIAAGCVTAASVLPGLVLHVPAGFMVDRVSRRKVMWASQLVRMATATLAFACLAFSCNSVVVLVVAALIDGACSVFYEVAEIAAVPDIVSKKSLNLAIGSNEAKLNASMLFGRPLGGALLAVAPMMPWLVTALTSLFSVFALLAIRRPKHRSASGKGRTGGPNAKAGGEVWTGLDRTRRKPGGKGGDLALRDVLERLMRDAFSRAVLTVCVLANFFFQVIVLLQILLAEQRGLPSYLVGLLLACSGLGGFLGAVGSPFFLRKPPSMSVVFCVLAWIPLAWIIGTGDNPVVGLAMWGLCSVIGAYINVALRAHQANTFPSELLGSVTGITRFLSVGAVALGALSGGWIIHLLGTEGTGILVGVAFTAIAGILMVVLHFAFVRDRLLDAFARMREMGPAVPGPPAAPDHGVELVAEPVGGACGGMAGARGERLTG
ncbi:MFS transporter [Actinomadura livida]|uniref:MFS family permease n=1 Tax=Actinomadura livida TaxID=79909 RepID=A0A7W7I9M7_9ACTN|nr:MULTISPECIES: MFS transporter [Actinomadura]MBB4773072.1 MFS family permease [Actinomadura catellatispora]GGU17725.1 MFS transporter [Actinomadura livida]